MRIAPTPASQPVLRERLPVWRVLLDERHGRGTRFALADTFAMQLHIDEISHHVAEGAHAVLTDRAGLRTTAKLAMLINIVRMLLPARVRAEPDGEHLASHVR